MSLEQSVATLLTRGDALLGLPQLLADQATAAVTRVEAAAMARLNSMSSFVVDQVNGDDAPARSGLAAQPLKTLEAALARTPIGSTCWVALAGPYLMSTIVVITDKTLAITSTSSVRHAITFARSSLASGGSTFRNLAGFRLAFKAQIGFLGVGIVMPVLDGAYTAQLEYQESAIIRVSGSPQDAMTNVAFNGCDIALPAAPFGRICGHFDQPLSLLINSCTLTDQPLTGRTVRVQTNTTTGVATSTYRWLLTNLLTI